MVKYFLHNNSLHRNWSNGHNDLTLQLSVSKSKPDHICELLEATKMTKYFKNHTKTANYTMLIMIIMTLIKFRVIHINQINMSTKHITTMMRLTKKLAKVKCFKAQNQRVRTLRMKMILTVLRATLILHQTEYD